jgi:hypothetical protein
MINNNIDNLIFANHDTFVYYPLPLLASEHKINLPPVNTSVDNVTYSSFNTDLYNQGLKVGKFKVIVSLV